MVGVSVHEAERISCSDPNYFDAQACSSEAIKHSSIPDACVAQKPTLIRTSSYCTSTSGGAYGRRLIADELRAKSHAIGERRVARLMAEGETVAAGTERRKRKHRSYKGEISERPGNRIRLDFSAALPAASGSQTRRRSRPPPAGCVSAPSSTASTAPS